MDLSLHDISKKYKDRMAVNDITLTLTPGVWGLLGANGAGKTTLMRMIIGILSPSSGNLQLDGEVITGREENYRSMIGYLPQNFGYCPEFTVIEYLNYVAVLKGIPSAEAKLKIDELLERLTLTEVKKKPIRKLSGGMQRRVGIAQALLNEPQILILDEPTSGLDPGERVRFRNLITEFAKDKIVLISTHIVSDVEYIATQNAIMKEGQILRVGTTEELVQEIAGKVYTAKMTAPELLAYENAVKIVNTRNDTDGNILVRYVSDAEVIANSTSVEPRLEDLYLWIFRNKTYEVIF